MVAQSDSLVFHFRLVLDLPYYNYSHGALTYNTTNVKNMHPHRDSNSGPWITVPML